MAPKTVEGGQIWLKCITGDLIMMIRDKNNIFERVKKNHAEMAWNYPESGSQMSNCILGVLEEHEYRWFEQLSISSDTAEKGCLAIGVGFDDWNVRK